MKLVSLSPTHYVRHRVCHLGLQVSEREPCFNYTVNIYFSIMKTKVKLLLCLCTMSWNFYIEYGSKAPNIISTEAKCYILQITNNINLGLSSLFKNTKLYHNNSYVGYCFRKITLRERISDFSTSKVLL